MRFRLAGALAMTGVLVGMLALGVSAAKPTHWMMGRSVKAQMRTPVIVELFTSEGCSDCPPADKVLTDLERTQPVPGAEVIALGQHVDYWNHGGWADRYSAHAYSTRQNDYANAFHLDSVYTPQMIVDGRTQFVGSDRNRAVQAIAAAARAPKASVTIQQVGTGQGSTVPLQISIGTLPAGQSAGTADVILAVTEDGLHSQVGGGENAGRSLVHSAVVRDWHVIGTWNGNAAKTFTTQVHIPSGWNRHHLRVVVFAQEQGRNRVLGAAAQAVA